MGFTIDRFAACFSDRRSAKDVEHTVATLVGQRVFSIGLGKPSKVSAVACSPRRLGQACRRYSASSKHQS
jgi:hypothetical protein